MRKHALLSSLALLVAVFVFADLGQARKTRDLVFEDDEQASAAATPKDQTVVAVRTAIELERGGQKTTVLPDYEFKSGDKAKFVYTTNTDAYVYWLSQGTSGEYVMLFPTPKTGTDNLVKKNAVHTIPVKGAFKFDEKAGTEKILLVLSTERIPELEAAAKEAALKDGKVVSESSKVTSVQEQTETKRKTRDLVFEEDDDKESGIATSKQINTNPKDAFVVYYELKHQ